MAQETLSLRKIIEQVSAEKGIDPAQLVEATRVVILAAAKRTFGGERWLEARWNEETGWVDLFQVMKVRESVTNPHREISLTEARRHGLDVEVDDELDFKIFYREEEADEARKQENEFGDLIRLRRKQLGFGRIAAQAAKGVIQRFMRDAERERIYNQYKDRIGEIITGTVRRLERGHVIVDVGHNVEAILPAREQTPRETYRPGDRIVALLKTIDREERGPQLILSRADRNLLVKLFEMEVPEIYEGIVTIVAAAREPGARSKIAVRSRDRDVDPVGACVGMKGSRVQAVVQELRGEKIDIVPWNPDPARFVCNAIAPADVTRVVIDDARHAMELVVPDAKLSLAIGRRGQNVRLASQLTGWKLDIISESRYRQIEEEALAELVRIEGVGEELAKVLYKMGFRGAEEVAEASLDELAAIPGIGERAAAIQAAATETLEVLRRERLEAAARRPEPLSERERLLLVRGMSESLADALERAGYVSVDDLARETDGDRVGLRAGIGAARGRALHAEAVRFVREEWPPVEERRRQLRAVLAAAAATDESATIETRTEG
ncbi:MAG: transcription termination factor NusA [Myxococcales bacterium]|nr:transcription termination factor NusA [Myxococcales bacterium]